MSQLSNHVQGIPHSCTKITCADFCSISFLQFLLVLLFTSCKNSRMETAMFTERDSPNDMLLGVHVMTLTKYWFKKCIHCEGGRLRYCQYSLNATHTSEWIRYHQPWSSIIMTIFRTTWTDWGSTRFWERGYVTSTRAWFFLKNFHQVLFSRLPF